MIGLRDAPWHDGHVHAQVLASVDVTIPGVAEACLAILNSVDGQFEGSPTGPHQLDPVASSHQLRQIDSLANVLGHRIDKRDFVVVFITQPERGPRDLGVTIICVIRLRSGSTICPTGRIPAEPRGS